MVELAESIPRRLRVAALGRGARGAVTWDLALAAVLAVASFVPQLAGNGLSLGELTRRQGDLWAVVLTLGQCLPLSVRRRWPAWCLALVAGCFAAYQCLGYRSDFAGVGVFAALYSAGAHVGADRSRRGLIAAVTAGYLTLAIALHHLGSPERPLDYCTFYIALLACWGGGAWVRGRQALEAARRREDARLAISRERARIAWELHDVVTHHVTAIVVQADTAQLLVSGAPDRAVESLTAISGTGRRALAELRHLLGVLETPADGVGRPEADRDGPGAGRAPALDRFRDLVERTRLAGQPVELSEDGEPTPLAAGTELAAYRVVQETLTNAVKHAPGRRTVVRVRYGEEIHIEVTTDGPVVAEGAFTAGRGLTGLHERVSSCGGELAAGGRPGGGFSVRARIPSGAGL
ncbi:sensor histidine kinase [Streptomyces sp. NRRL F-5126]|uniref:sensor histidine kinase n=1 Tax=Streptomyces sp. NRRL F-5126 TaxID=1463857 RepID=UPI001F4369D4|nr:histidine kinase [Streptomyces sp. NRRL F-5126]